MTWKNDVGVTHTLSGDSNSTTAFDSGNPASGSTFTFTFTSVGDCWYHCSIHPTMHGMVHVVVVGALY